MTVVSFSLKTASKQKSRFFSFEVEKNRDFTEVLDKFLKSRRIKLSLIDFLHIKLSEESSLLDAYIIEALLKARKIASFFDKPIKD
ncbi:MAG: hypothetical protein UX26_C0023G0003 [Parcubacteria group bacterium GW2011_GWC1_45_9]|nr:MAG: hypothetical protein UW85_C0006G0005 [Parcubacteria group bacterium GW2011_GWA1_Parcubacteria_45_10]KKT88619.1 MAG: hypothetical protein UW89_C0006G0027 [Parcubacteria group bacterium GW2011_GWB1_45_10]KKU16485.1 MAG: hypothetical protein UX26_C0023G0003 [Parcubacteria group bacterium GW2011_GWC1_45_9]HCI05459.1 hypothetical protein [Patescibacteria group bacterium]